MKYLISFATVFLALVVSTTTSSVFAATNLPVSASVPGSSFNPPTLISPAANATINTTKPVFSWSRPSPVPSSPLNHYDLIIDGAFFANISDSVTTADYYFYSVSRSGDTFTVTLKTDLTQGYHTWSVTAYNDAGVTSSSETRTFYIDSIPPNISVTQVDKQILTWTTADPNSIPAVEYRFINVTVPNPLIKGTVEISANIQISLICPQNIPSCATQLFSGNVTSGNWQNTFNGLIPNEIYTVRISATDAGSNSTIFPEFYIRYAATVTPTPTTVTPTITPTGTPTITSTPTPPDTTTPAPTSTAGPTLPLPSITATPPPGELSVITPTPFIPITPPAPTAPPQVVKPPVKITPDLFYLFLVLLIIFGIILHLLMAIIGTGTPLIYIHKFLFILIFPFLRRHKYQTVPFAFIDFYYSDKLDKPWQSVVSDIKGFYNLRSPIPKELFISLRAIDRTWKDNIFKGSLIPITCLFPIPVDPIESKRLQRVVYEARLIPLAIAFLASITALILRPSNEMISCVFVASLYLFSEYLYPRI